MKRTISAALLAAALLSGCAESKPAPRAAPVRVEEPDTTALRASLQKNPDVAAIGAVSIILPDAPWLDVDQMNMGDVRLGDTLSIVTADFTVIAHGTVAALKKDGVHMDCHPIPGRRSVQVGDIAIKFKS